MAATTAARRTWDKPDRHPDAATACADAAATRTDLEEARIKASATQPP